MERGYQDKILAKSFPDRVETWSKAGVQIRAEIWEDVVLPDVTPSQQAKTFQVSPIGILAHQPKSEALPSAAVA